MALVNEYLDLTRGHIESFGPNTIVLMQVGSFYEAYGRSASVSDDMGSPLLDFATVCELNVVEKAASNGTLQAGFGVQMLDKYINRLQNAGYTTIVMKQRPDPDAVGKFLRSIDTIYSPGTDTPRDKQDRFDKLDFGASGICCIWLEAHGNHKMLHTGIAHLDVTTGRSVVCEIHDEDANLMNSTNSTNSTTTTNCVGVTSDELQRFISCNLASEYIIVAYGLHETDIANIISLCKIDEGVLVHKIILSAPSKKQETVGVKVVSVVSVVEEPPSKRAKIQKETQKEKEKETPMQHRARNCMKQTYHIEVLKTIFGDARKEKGSGERGIGERGIGERGIGESWTDTFHMSPFYKSPIATQAYCFLLDFVSQHNPALLQGISLPDFEHHSDRLLLANHTLQQLNVIPTKGAKISKYGSVLSFLNNCVTPMGRREFAKRLLRPTTNCDRIEEEYNITDHIIHEMARTEEIYNVRGIMDMEAKMRMVMLGRISPRALYTLSQDLRTANQVIRNIQSEAGPIHAFLRKQECFDHDSCHVCEELLHIMEQLLNLDSCAMDDALTIGCHNFIITGTSLSGCVMNIVPDTEKIIHRLQSELDDRYSAFIGMRQALNDIIAQNEKKQSSKCNDYIKIQETDAAIGLTTTKRRASILKTCVQSSISTSSQTGTYDFIHSSEIDYVSGKIMDLKTRLRAEINSEYSKAIALFATPDYVQSVTNMTNTIATIDVIISRAQLAMKHKYCRPVIMKTVSHSYIKATRLRHALLEQIHYGTNPEIYKANDVTLGTEMDKGILLYGTNAVGKTSFIKSIGIAIIMAQAGLYVPAHTFEFSPYSYIFSRIIGNDNMFQGLSTFAVEMSELRTILQIANNQSLVLGDELCSGTESVSAAALFVAGIQELQQRKSSFIFATHMHEIVGYSEIAELLDVRVKHMTVTYDRQSGKLIYDRIIKDGQGDTIYGLEVCKALHLPTDFLERANNLRIKYHPMSAGILSFKTSHFSSKKIVGVCEECHLQLASEVHHIHPQALADTNGMLSLEEGIFHKNHPANLRALCEQCHDNEHRKKN